MDFNVHGMNNWNKSSDKKQSERNEGKCFHGIKSEIKILTGVISTYILTP